MANALQSDGTAFKQDLRHLADGVEALRSDGRVVAHEVANVARSGVAEIQQGAKHAVEAAKGKLEDAKDAAGEAVESARGVIARNPLAAIGIAVGAGLLIGMLLRRSRS